MYKIGVINDFLRDPSIGLYNHTVNRRWLASIVQTVGGGQFDVSQIGAESSHHKILNVGSMLESLSVSTDSAGWAAAYDLPPTPDFIETLRKLLEGIDIIVSFGASNVISRAINELKIPFLDFEVSPIRFLPTLTFDLRTNIIALQESGYLSYHDLPAKFGAAAAVARFTRQASSLIPDDAGPVGIIFGQQNTDAALINRGRIASFDEFADDIQIWAKNLEHVLFRPHPYSENNDHLDTLVGVLPLVRPTLMPSYQLLSSKSVTKTIALSSSIIDEASYFGIKAERLFLPPRRRAEFTYCISTGIDALNPAVLKAICEGHDIPVRRPIQFDIRPQLGFTWGYGGPLATSDFERPPVTRNGKLESSESIPTSQSSKSETEVRIDTLEKQVYALNCRPIITNEQITKITNSHYLLTRSLWERLLFRPSGRPKRAVQRILFHSNGKPRGIFRKWILHSDGRPHRPFAKWMQSAEYQLLRKSIRLEQNRYIGFVAAPHRFGGLSMEHDLSLNSGERQVATEYSGIRSDHRFRYEWANDHISDGGFGLDIFCGNGYGTWLLAQTRIVIGIDASIEAIRLAETHFRTARTLFSSNYYPFDLPSNTFDFIVSLESVEHVRDGLSFFQSLVNSLKPGGLIVFSTPCEDLLPHAVTGNHFHFKHYTLQETLALASSYGLELLDWAGQNTYAFQADGKQGSLLPESEMHLRKREAGQFIVLLSRKR